MRKIGIILLAILLSLNAAAQTTKVKGRVLDADTGEPMPFVGVYFDGTTIGVSTDMEGNFSLETRDRSAQILTAHILGYEPQSFAIVPGSFSEVNFSLRIASDQLNAAIVKPDNRYMKWILGNINKNKKRNNPDKHPGYKCKVYNKTELDLTNPEEHLHSKVFDRNFGFVFDYMDTSVVSGQAYLPVMFAESVTRRFHAAPDRNREIIEASRFSGLNPDNVLRQFTGSLYFKSNFYDNFVNAFNVEIPSPLSPGGDVFYNYFLIDSLKIDGRKTYKIRYHPKKFISSPVFDGEMSIDAQEWALKSMHAKLARRGNVNWLRDIVIDVENQRLDDSTWFFLSEKIYADLSISLNEKSKMLSFIANRSLEYSDPVYEVPSDEEFGNVGEETIVEQDSGRRDSLYWNEIRPYELTEKEKGVYTMVDQVKEVPLFQVGFDVVNMIAVNHYETKYIGIGPVMQSFSFNEIEGFRLRPGVRTTKEFSRKVRLSAFAAYGFRDRKFKGGGKVEWTITPLPWRKLVFEGKRDMVQMGEGSDALIGDGNILKTLLAREKNTRMSLVDKFSLSYEREWLSGFSTIFGIQHRTLHANRFINYISPDGVEIPNFTDNQAHLMLRFAPKEQVGRGVFENTHLTSKFPIFTLDLYGGVKGISPRSYEYLRAELGIRWRITMAPIGFGNLKINAGWIFGSVPYPLLKLHEGNATYYFDKSAFSTMNYYEYASDRWVQLIYEHNFYGFFLGKIPFMRRLAWREVAYVKAAWGTISEQNSMKGRAPLQFPDGMKTLEKPFVEAGVGITNIFRLFRIDAVWRLTHVYEEDINGNIIYDDNGKKKLSPRRFTINAGIEIRF